MRRAALYLMLLATACAQRPPVPPQEPLASLCACRAICAPDGYVWTLVWMGPTDGGRCTCSRLSYVRGANDD